jgi:DNA-binding MarR family transcriptional regulator
MYEYLVDRDTHSSRKKTDSAIGLRLDEAVRANQTATDVFDDAYATFLGINRTDARCIDIIDQRTRVTAGQLASESGLTTGAVTAILDRLERQHYVRRVRDDEDRRKIYVELTHRCREIGWHIFGHFARLSPVLKSRFSPEQVRGIIQFLEMGTYLNRQMAAVLARHAEPDDSGQPDRRLEQAKAFEQAAEAEMPRVTRDLEAIARNVDESF